MIKFLKKFKEKILIVLACFFICIGTLLNNTIETKAYISNQYSYSVTYDSNKTDNLNSAYYTLNTPITSSTNYALLFNLDTSSLNGSITCYCYAFLGSNFTSSNSFSDMYLYSNSSFVTYINTKYTSCYGVSITLYNNSRWLNVYNYITNIDVVPCDDVTIEPYLDSYSSQLQSDYDTLQVEYIAYQNTHAYTNEQYSNLMSQNATLSQQVLDLQNQYDTYVSLHSYTNEQYETLLTNYNNLQNIYSNLQASYLVLQQQYDSLSLSVAPFTSSKWNNRTGSLNGVTYDMQNEYRDSLVSFEKTYLFITARDLDVFDNYSTGSNTFVLTAYCNQNVVLSGFNVIANLSHIREESFQIDFYLDNNLVYSTIDFDNDMGDDDSNTISVDRFLEFNQITITVVVTYDGLYSSNGYFNAVVGTWQDGYDYAVGQLMPQINRLENELRESNAQQQVKYSEGYTNGFNDANSQPLYGMIIRIL